MLKEIEYMKKLADKFLDPHSIRNVILPWRTELQTYQNNPKYPVGSRFRWEIKETNPIQTLPSEGGYEPDSKGALTVFGQLSAVWDIKVENDGKVKKKRPKERFILRGKASTKIKIFGIEGSNNLRELARWCFEIGDSNSPGCYFHVQIPGKDSEDFFSLPVPRFPGILVTPMDGLEFLLGEIFQDEWKKHSIQNSHTAIVHWASFQRPRLISLLNWQIGELKKPGGSPWTTLKSGEPKPDILFN